MDCLSWDIITPTFAGTWKQSSYGHSRCIYTKWKISFLPCAM